MAIYKVNGRRLTDEQWEKFRCRGATEIGPTAVAKYWDTPKKSGVFGVHPKQVKAEEQRLADLGCPTKVCPDGDVMITSQRHEDRLFQVNGMEPLRDR